MARITREFYCAECHKYFDIKLNMDLEGNYRIHCPNCEHVHYRTVSKGIITGERFPKNAHKMLIEDIRPMKSSCRDTKTETELDSHLVESTEGFVHRLWVERHSGKL